MAISDLSMVSQLGSCRARFSRSTDRSLTGFCGVFVAPAIFTVVCFLEYDGTRWSFSRISLSVAPSVFRFGSEISEPKPLKPLNSQICQICGDTVGLTATGDVFVACNECAFPVCRACYEYERKDGNQACPQCKTRYKRLKGSPQIDGYDDEEDVDDIDNEFNYPQGNNKARQQWQGSDAGLSSSSRHGISATNPSAYKWAASFW